MEAENRFATALAALNTEPKSIILLSLDDKLKGSTKIRHAFKRQLGEAVWVPNHNTIRDLCDTLTKLGYLDRGHTGWTVTEEGKEYGKPIANFMLNKAAALGMSMRPILGPTHSSSEERAPYNRARIIECLSDGETHTATDLGAHTHNTQCITYHLDELQKQGLVRFESSQSRPIYGRHWTGKSLDDVVKMHHFSQETCRAVAKVFSDATIREGDINIAQAYQKLREQGSKLAFETVNDITYKLQFAGFVESVPEKQSKVVATEFGKAFMTTVLDPVKQFCGDCKSPEILELQYDPAVWTAALMTYEPKSGMSAQLHVENLRRVCNETGRGIRPVEYAKMTGMPKGSANALFNNLHNLGLVIREHEGMASYYSPKEN